MKQFLLSIILTLGLSQIINAQNNFDVTINGLKENDSVRVIVQKSSEIIFQKWVKNNGTGAIIAGFDLSEGKWALIIDTKGYTFPAATYVNIPEVNTATITLTPLLTKNYNYNWEDDSSFAGHATQVYVNEPSKLVVLNDTISVPDDYSAVKLRNEFGIVLSNDKTNWSSEDSYKLYTSLNALPIGKFGEGQIVDVEKGVNLKAVFYLTQDEQFRDISIEIKNDIKYVTVSQSAFVYANPQIVTLDGIKGKYFSKRLYHAIVNYYTDFAKNAALVDKIAMGSFGIRFMKPDQETENLMSEAASNFQDFFDDEKVQILAMFEEMPEGFHKIDGLKYLVRRINGQDNPVYPAAAAIAWTGIKTIEFMSKSFNSSGYEDVSRLILHEKAHFLWAYTFDDNLKNDWATLGGWFQDPTSGSGWLTYNTTEFVSAYAHANNPNEDMAESVATYITNPDLLLSRSVRKYEFIRDRIMHGTRYIAQIREDLTFTVYNLFPDYTYPGKVTAVDIDVQGLPEEDKEITIKIKLNSKDPDIDGASFCSMRIVSSIGTFVDIGLNPVNGKNDSTLIGKCSISKLAKSGYWNLAYANLVDNVGNTRYENTATLGFKLYIENPLEDVVPPKWNYDFVAELIQKAEATSGTNSNQKDSSQTLKIKYTFYDDSPLERTSTNIYFAKLENTSAQRYEMGVYDGVYVNESLGYKNDYKSNKHFELNFDIKDYYPTGYYAFSSILAFDKAGNRSTVYLVKDTADFNLDDNFKIYKDVRDSIYIKTKYPDYLSPLIDVNNIKVTAKPTNEINPDGETRVDISLLTKDISDYIGHESGITAINLTLRDPLGVFHGYQTGNGTMNHTDIKTLSNLEWNLFKFNFLLPQGSPPGKWGISSIQTQDASGNFKNYSFVEIVRFDVIESNVVLLSPLEIQITDKVVNTLNVNSITAEMSCAPCKDKNYVYTIYSLMGGNVVRGEGVFSADSISVANIDTRGVLDGVIKLTVQVTDAENRLIATKTTEYTKDTVLPKAYYLKTNLENTGTSNLDDFVIAVVVEQVDLLGKYSIEFSKNPSPNSGKFTANKLGNSSAGILFEGEILKEEITLSNLDLTSLADGIIVSTTIITDPNGNEGSPVKVYYYKANGKITLIGSTLAVDEFAYQNLISDLVKASPNPTKGRFELNLTTDEPTIEIEIISIEGKFISKSIYPIENGKVHLNIEKEATGIYFVKVGSNPIRIVKMIKN